MAPASHHWFTCRICRNSREQRTVETLLPRAENNQSRYPWRISLGCCGDKCAHDSFREAGILEKQNHLVIKRAPTENLIGLDGLAEPQPKVRPRPRPRIT